jgi:hypothetical protein
MMTSSSEKEKREAASPLAALVLVSLSSLGKIPKKSGSNGTSLNPRR